MKKITLWCFFLICIYTQSFSQEKKFILLHTGDEHSTLLPIPLSDYQKGSQTPAIGGFARLATKIKQIKASNPGEPMLLFSSGDIMGGSPFAWLIPVEMRSVELKIMQKIGYNGINFGNHEFDYGPDILAKILENAGYKNGHPATDIFNTDINIPDKSPLGQVNVKSSKIYTLSNGLKIGVFGILSASSLKLEPEAKDLTTQDKFEIGNKTVQELRKAGADVVVLLSHTGLDIDKEMAKKIKGIDIILGGHDHIQTPKPLIVNQTIIVHSGHYLGSMGKLELSFDPKTHHVKLENENYIQEIGSDIAEDLTIYSYIQESVSRLDSFIQQYTNGQFTDIQEYVLQSSFDVKKDADFKETTIGNFLTDAMRIEAGKITGDKVDLAFQGNGVIRGDIIPGTQPWSKGKFDFFDMVTLLGLGKGPDHSPAYPMVSCYLTEGEIFNALEATIMLSQLYGDMFFLQVSGIKFTYDPGKSMWLKIPFTNTPIPASKAVKSVFLYTGEGRQDNSKNYIELHRNGKHLYHVVTDYYVASFLPMVGKVLPKLKITFKDKAGNEKSLDECVIHQADGKEFKSWQSSVLYAKELGEIPADYQKTQGRIVQQAGIPLRVWSYSVLALVLLGIIYLVKRLLSRKKNKA